MSVKGGKFKQESFSTTLSRSYIVFTLLLLSVTTKSFVSLVLMINFKGFLLFWSHLTGLTDKIARILPSIQRTEQKL